jgi:redox-sensitive bicupin YhaK (pirin superfamily)
MITIRKSDERGHFNFGWLDTKHSFSFGDYFDKDHMGFRSLRVINEDIVAPGKGFGRHPHQDMEIITYVLSGSLAHQDWVNGKPTNAQTLSPGEVQHMTAGTGVEHAEFNASKTEPVHMLQIWIKPSRRGLGPSYDQKRFERLAPPESGRWEDLDQQPRGKGSLVLVASPDAATGSVKINQDARLYVGRMKMGQGVELPLDEGRHAWVQVTRGEVSANGSRLNQGDGAAVSQEARLLIENMTADEAEVLVFDLA